MEVAIVFIFSYFAAASSSKCDLKAPLPKSVPMSYMRKIGTWYQTVSANDLISNQFVCATLSKVSVNLQSETFSALVTKYYNTETARSFNVKDRRTEDGYFERFKVDDREIPALLYDQNEKLNLKALEEGYRISINPDKHSFIGDGNRYLAFVKCTSEGWAVWIVTPQKVLTTEDLLYIRNELVKIGIHTELRLGKCEDINPE